MRKELFPSQNTLDEREEVAIKIVLNRGRLSYYRGSASPEFYGGTEIKALEKKWSETFNVQNSIACNSATSGLHIACGAIGLKPGDEVIVTPWSMTCSATAPLLYGAIPIFADIEKDYFCLDPKSIEKKVTNRTRAIIVVDLFGQPYDVEAIGRVAKKYNLYVIEDAAQALFSQRLSDGKYAGTFGHIGVYSFNFGKHITCGEGGMIVTDDFKLQQRIRLIMNHAESVCNDFGLQDFIKYDSELNSLIGFNMRMTEMQAAIVSVQLDKFQELQKVRMENVCYLNDKLSEIDGIKPVKIRNGYTHTYYALPFLYDKEKKGKIEIHRDYFIEKVIEQLTPRKGRDGEGVPIGCGYIKPIYLMPLFQKLKHWAFNCYENRAISETDFELNYRPGSCPNTEKLWQDELFLTLYHAPNSTVEDMVDIVNAFNF